MRAPCPCCPCPACIFVGPLGNGTVARRSETPASTSWSCPPAWSSTSSMKTGLSTPYPEFGREQTNGFFSAIGSWINNKCVDLMDFLVQILKWCVVFLVYCFEAEKFLLFNRSCRTVIDKPVLVFRAQFLWRYLFVWETNFRTNLSLLRMCGQQWIFNPKAPWKIFGGQIAPLKKKKLFFYFVRILRVDLCVWCSNSCTNIWIKT